MIDTATQELTERLAGAMLKHELSLVTAESCTGGGIAHSVTSIAGSSGWFDRGFVTYTNDAKRECLGVSTETLTNFGAVSEECAAEMVLGALQNSHAGIAVSVTGLAGPGGGSEDKPVGTVCFGWCQRNQSSVTTRVVFEGDREQVRRQSVLLAMQGLLDMLEA
ncbi:MAG: nicotinamide-nucleotide amidohydrolase family protein [Gammaproteobacteria bacterium]|nr:nicotinamide-nucleotide amidohydrolase family protein [Gammaproteobacteria bacterium]